MAGLPFEDDADRLAQLESLGESLVVDGVEVTGIWVDDYVDADIGAAQAVSSSQPMIMLRDVDVVGLPAEASVVRVGTGEQFVVAHPPRPDGTGMVRLLLHELPP